MANTKLNILKPSRQLFFVVSIVLAGFVFLHAPKAQAAACAPPTTDMGSVTSTINVTTAGTYRVWSRIMSGTAATDNSYSLEIDGSSCLVVGDNNSMPNGSWQWVNYKNGSTTTPISVSLAAGSHTIKMIGREDGVKLDRVGFTTDIACSPTGTGDNCFPPADTTPPTASITSPSANAKLKGTVPVSANANDDSGTISKVEFYVDGVMVGTADTTSPYSFNWNTTTASNGAHTIKVKAYDGASPANVGTSAGVSVTVDNSPPTVSLTAPAAGATLTGTANLAATAADNIGVTSVDFYYGTNLISSDTTGPSYQYSWDTTSIANGDYALTAKAFDGAGNVTTSTAVNVTINNTTQVPDTEKPITSITKPLNGDTIVDGTLDIIVRAKASDNVGVDHVDLYIDGALAGTDTSSPFIWSIDPIALGNGPHTLQTKAFDTATPTPNQGDSAVINISIDVAPPTISGDITGPTGVPDGFVDGYDLNIIGTNWGKSVTQGDASQGDIAGPPGSPYDGGPDGVVNAFDLDIIGTQWHPNI